MVDGHMQTVIQCKLSTGNLPTYLCTLPCESSNETPAHIQCSNTYSWETPVARIGAKLTRIPAHCLSPACCITEMNFLS